MALVRGSLSLTSVLTRTVRNASTQNARLCSLCIGPSDSLLTVQRCRKPQLYINEALPTNTLLYRSYAKAKKKGQSSKSGGKGAAVSDEDAGEVLNLDKYREELDGILEGLKQDFQQNMTLRTNFASFDRLLIKTDDGNIPLNQIATITQKSPSLIMIDMPRTRQYVANVLEALEKSSMNLNPQQEKTHTIFVNIPKVSREHRENMVKGTKTMFNDSKEKISKVYAKYLKQVNSYINNKGDRNLGENMKVKILEEMKDGVNKAENMMKAKQKELLS